MDVICVRLGRCHRQTMCSYREREFIIIRSQRRVSEGGELWGWRVICSIIIHRDRHAIDSTHHHMLTLCVNALYRHCLRYNVCSIALKTLCRYNIMINHITTYRPTCISRNLKTKYLSSIYFIKYYIIWRYTCVAVFPSINLYPFKQKLYLHICYILYRTPRTIEHITNMLRSTCAHHFIRETNISRMWRARARRFVIFISSERSILRCARLFAFRHHIARRIRTYPICSLADASSVLMMIVARDVYR